ncbi:hypothetical protein B7982_05935 [Fibrobacter sp. UWB2]|uniref:hypothetical protein n=1 Tax=Fibrobacter sp. UWB2 TaxID=1964358 RepID=UPI000B51F750|nr:hypothetical protein [Fibrobacter sp. UWB2]OWV23965.1 hypothetical protein B7982_05935 [Fibrobacter sp. UWB2]
MKKINLMQNLFAMSLACVTVLSGGSLLAGCSGFTEDTNTSSNDNGGLIDVQAAFASARVSRLGKVIVDESQDSLTIVYETFGGCLKNDNGVYAYNSDFYFANSRTYAYSFHGDTLVMSYGFINHEKGSLYDLNFYLIGGNPGDLNGVWMYLPCTSFGDEHSCPNEMENLFIQFNNGSVETRVSENKTYDYMNSSFVLNLALFMTGHENRIDFDLRGQVMSMDNDLSGNGFTVQERTNKNMKFVYKEHQYELNVDYVQVSDSASVTLSSEGLSCSAYLSERDDVSSEICREENADYLYENGKGSLGYRKDNSEEFASCVKTLVNRKTNASLSDKSGNNDVQTAFESARLNRVGKAIVDESKDSVTFVLGISGGCFRKDGKLYYDADYYFEDVDRFAYNFRNDTLQLSYIDEDEIAKELVTVQWVGGTSGVLDGTWRTFPCLYVDSVYGCGNDAYEKFFKLDGDYLEHRVGDVPNYDYMNTNFVGDIFGFLNGKHSIMIEDVFYSRSDFSPEKYGITVQEKTKKSMKFTHEGRTFDLKVDFVRYSDTVAVTLSSNGIACVGNYSKKNDVPPELCREENSAYLQSSRNDSKSDALQYKKDNRSEFEQCIKDIVGLE